MSSQTARHDSGDIHTAATGVPAQRTGRAPTVPDPLVGPPVPSEATVRGTQADTAEGRTATAETGAAGIGTVMSPAASTDLHSASTAELLKRLSTQLSDLIRGEMELARTELTAKGKRAGTGAGLAGAGGVVALYGVGALIAAAIAALALMLPVWLSALIVGVVLLLVAGVLALAGRRQLRRATPPMPEQAVESVQRDVETVKEAVQR
jgi:hypothetical protein